MSVQELLQSAQHLESGTDPTEMVNEKIQLSQVILSEVIHLRRAALKLPSCFYRRRRKVIFESLVISMTNQIAS